MKAVDVEAVRAQLCAIAHDAKQDAQSLDGQPFTGRTIAGYFGQQLAMIARLAEVVETLLPERETERDPVPFVDYLPESEKCIHIRPCWDIECKGGR